MGLAYQGANRADGRPPGERRGARIDRAELTGHCPVAPAAGSETTEEPEVPRERRGLRECVQRQRACSALGWPRKIAGRLGLERTMPARGRPKKSDPKKQAVPFLFSAPGASVQMNIRQPLSRQTGDNAAHFALGGDSP